jgi:RNA polymerase sigma-70 factor (ECF subfamily)
LPVDRKADEEVIDRVLAGDREAFAVLVDRHGGRVHGAILRMVGDPEAANDLAQETLLRAFTGLRNFRRGAAFYTWLYAIAVNQVRTEFRKRRSVKGQAMLPLEAAAGRGAGDDAEGRVPEPAGSSPSPSDEASTREEAVRLRRALDGLDAEYREAVVLRDLEGLSYEEIAEATGTPVGTVRSRIHRGRAALRETLVPERGRTGGSR